MGGKRGGRKGEKSIYGYFYEAQKRFEGFADDVDKTERSREIGMRWLGMTEKSRDAFIAHLEMGGISKSEFVALGAVTNESSGDERDKKNDDCGISAKGTCDLYTGPKAKLVSVDSLHISSPSTILQKSPQQTATFDEEDLEEKEIEEDDDDDDRLFIDESDEAHSLTVSHQNEQPDVQTQRFAESGILIVTGIHEKAHGVDVQGRRELPAQSRLKRQITSNPDVLPNFTTVGNGHRYFKKYQKCAKCPYRTKRHDLWSAHQLLHEEGSQAVECEDCGCQLAPEKLAHHRATRHPIPRTIRKIKKKTAQLQPAPDRKCPLCPYKTKDVTCYKHHSRLHEVGSGATACEWCGIFANLAATGSLSHRFKCVGAIRASLGKDKNLNGVGSKRIKREVDHSNPHFESFLRGGPNRRQYGCRQCPYETLTVARMNVHVELHEEGSTAVSCGECGWFLPPEQFEIHRVSNHS